MKRIWTMQEARTLVTALEVRFTAFAHKNGLEMSHGQLTLDKDESKLTMSNVRFSIKGGSTAQNFFEKQDVQYVRENVEAIVNTLKEEHSIFNFETGNMRYEHSFCRIIKLTLTYKVEGTLEDQYAHLNNEVLREALYYADASLTPSDRKLLLETKPVGKTYFYDGSLNTITNIDLKKPKYCVILEDSKGASFKATLNFLAIVIRRGKEVTK